MKSFLVIGLGRFGVALSLELCALGHEVLAVDIQPDNVRQVADNVTHAVCGDGRDPDVLKQLGAKNFDCGVVAIGNDVGGGALITMNLKEMGVPYVVSKAHNTVHRRVLEKVGADLVVFPEQQMALRLAQNLSNSNVVDFIGLSADFSIMERRVPQSWVDKTLVELGVRAQFNLNIIAIRSAAPDEHREGEMSISPGGGYRLKCDDTLVVLGRNDDIERLDKL